MRIQIRQGETHLVENFGNLSKSSHPVSSTLNSPGSFGRRGKGDNEEGGRKKERKTIG